MAENKNMKNDNKNKKTIKPVVQRIVIPCTKFAMLVANAGTAILPYGKDKYPPLMISEVNGDRFSVSVGDSKAIATLPQTDDGVGDKLVYTLFKDGTAKITTIFCPNIYDPILREISKTGLPYNIVIKSQRPEVIRPNESVRWFGKFQWVTDPATEQYRSRQKMDGAEVIIVSNKYPQNQNRIEVLRIINRDNASDETIAAFKEDMKLFYPAPNTAFDHLTIAKVEAPASVEATPPAKAKRATKAATKKAVEPKTETVEVKAIAKKPAVAKAKAAKAKATEVKPTKKAVASKVEAKAPAVVAAPAPTPKTAPPPAQETAPVEFRPTTPQEKKLAANQRRQKALLIEPINNAFGASSVLQQLRNSLTANN